MTGAMIVDHNNPQTVAFCNMLGISNFLSLGHQGGQAQQGGHVQQPGHVAANTDEIPLDDEEDAVPVAPAANADEIELGDD